MGAAGTVGAAGAACFGVILTSLPATPALGESLHGQGPALDTMVEGDAFFWWGRGPTQSGSGNGVVLDEIPQPGVETGLLQVCDS